MELINNLKNELLKAKTIALIGHSCPDVDCLASIISFKRTIKLNKNVFGEKEIDILLDNVEEAYSPLTKNETIVSVNGENKYDLAICFDCPMFERIGINQSVFNHAEKTIMIDHHEHSSHFADLNFIYKCSSTCELVYILFESLNLCVTNDVLKLIYSGIITDTVNLTQGTCRVSSYRVVFEIAKKLGSVKSLDLIKDYFLKNKSKSNLMLLKSALKSIRFYLNDKVAIMKITKEDLVNSKGQQADTLGIVNNAINIRGVAIAILFIKQDDGSYYVSLRSKNGVDSSKISKALGGGGHETVSAFSYEGKLSCLKENLLNLCYEQLKSETQECDPNTMFN